MINLSQVIISQSEIKSIIDVCKSGQIAQGKKVAEFEEKFARFCRVKYAVALNSGTAALHSALYACGIKPGDEVITTPFTFVATANSILMTGAKPIFVDIDATTFNIDPDKVEEKITRRTKAILPVDLYGHIFAVEKIGKIARKYNLKIIEDAAQAVGAQFKGKKAGTFGDVGCFSFYATKNLFTGEGGMVVTDDKKIYELVRMFRHHGQMETKRYEYYDLGYNYRMTEIEAVMGINQLQQLEKNNLQRIKNAQLLSQGLENIKGLTLPRIKPDYKHIFHQYTIRVTPKFKIGRNKLSEYLYHNGISSSIYYPKPLHLFRHFSQLNYKKGDYPISEQISKEVLSIPVHQHVTARDIDYIINVIRKVAK